MLFQSNFGSFTVTQISKNYFLPSQVSTVVGKSIEGDVFQLVFKVAAGRILIADLYMELFCNCTHGWLNKLSMPEGNERNIRLDEVIRL